jgi:hypothetical protein
VRSLFFSYSLPFVYVDSKPPAKKLKTAVADETCSDDTIDSSSLIEVQKSRAIARWDQAFARKDFDKTVYDNVLSQLHKGEVPPIFHALCREPTKRLFLPNTFVTPDDPESGRIELSTEKVVEGTSTILPENMLNENIWHIDGFSYLDAFLTKGGKGFDEVPDSFLHSDWNFNEYLTKKVAGLINTPAKMLGHDVEVTELESDINAGQMRGKNLVTRSLSRGVVADCFEHSKPSSNYAVSGSQGIGKSWSLIYALQQALLYENACVMFFFQHHDKAWLCIRKNNTIYVWRNESFIINLCGSGLFKNPNVLVLVDPNEDIVGGAPFFEGWRRLIFAACLNKLQFKSVGKRTPKFERILNPYTMNELRVALKYMSKSGDYYTDDEVAPMLKRVKKVGSMPRLILKEESTVYPMRCLAGFLASDNRLLIKQIFGPDRLKYLPLDDEETFGAFALYAFGSFIDDHDVNPTPLDVGYDGDIKVDYHTRVLLYASQDVKSAIARRYDSDFRSDSSCDSDFGHSSDSDC